MSNTITIDKQKMLLILITAASYMKDHQEMNDENLTWMEDNIYQIEKCIGKDVNITPDEFFILLQNYFIKCTG